jgi:predicted small lipoprotein YifL
MRKFTWLLLFVFVVGLSACGRKEPKDLPKDVVRDKPEVQMGAPVEGEGTKATTGDTGPKTTDPNSEAPPYDPESEAPPFDAGSDEKTDDGPTDPPPVDG